MRQSLEQLGWRRDRPGLSGSGLTAADAWWYWASRVIPSDQFLVYVFDGVPASIDGAVGGVLDAARSIPELCLRISESRLHVPNWARCAPGTDQIVIHDLHSHDWPAFLDALAGLMAQQLDPATAMWRLHVFAGLQGVPASPGLSTVTVLQVHHALADGSLAAALAGRLFNRVGDIPDVTPKNRGLLGRRIADAANSYRQRRLAVKAAATPLPGPVPALSTNASPTGKRLLGTLVVDASELPGPTATVGALVTVSEALGGCLRDRGESVADLTAVVAMARRGIRHSHNHFTSEAIRLHPDITDRDERARRIMAELRRRRDWQQQPGSELDERMLEVIPASLQRFVVLRFNRYTPRTVVGNTVVSSIDRGESDLRFGECPVLFTAGYPALAPAMGLTHGVHRLGSKVAISVHTTRSVMPDFDEYLGRLDAALGGSR